MGSQQVFIGFANFYRRFIQGFSRIATSLTAMLKTTGSSVASAFRVDDDEVVGGGGGAGAESGGRVGRSDASKKSQTESGLNCIEYPEDEKGVHSSRRPQRAGLITEEALTKVPDEYADFPYSQDWVSELPEHTEINDYAIELVDANRFIRPSKLPVGAPIFFDRKSDKSLRLCI